MQSRILGFGAFVSTDHATSYPGSPNPKDTNAGSLEANYSGPSRVNL